MSPAADTFVSASLDATVRLWDLRQSACQGLIHMPRTAPAARGTPWALAAFDPTGSVVAVAAPHAAPGAAEVKLFDAAQYERGPFSAATVPGVADALSLQFSPDGQRLLLLTAARRLLLLDTKPGSDKPLAVLVCSTFHLSLSLSHTLSCHSLYVNVLCALVSFLPCVPAPTAHV